MSYWNHRFCSRRN